MQFPRKAAGYGFLVWLVTLVVSMTLFPLKRSWPVLFDSAMPVALAAITVAFAHRYLRRCPSGFARESAWLGAAWLALNLLLDAPLFSRGPMRMTLTGYLADIGLTYLIIPVITVGLGLQAEAASGRSDRAALDPR